jgi:uncharacterized protein (AIM24 family)
MAAVDVTTPLVCSRGSVLAWDSSVEVDVKYAGARAIVLREGAVLLHLSGAGTAVFGSYGGIQEFTLTLGQEMVVDTGHLVAWEETVNLKLGMLGSATTATMSGEGIVGRLIGPGRVWCQTRSMLALEAWMGLAAPK